MKKIYFMAIAVIFALAMVGCDNFTAPDAVNSNISYDENGVLMTTLDLTTTGLGRALTLATGQPGTTFYEASFKKVSGGSISRTTWNWATSGRITLEPDDYDVMLFAGRESDKTLLAVGRVTSVGGGGSVASGVVTIDPTTTSLSFYVEALRNDVNLGPTSTFKVTDFGVGGGTTGAVVLPAKDDFGNDIPIFKVEKNDTSTAEWSFNIGAGNLGTYAPHMVVGIGGGEVLTTGYTEKGSLDVPQMITTAYGGPAAGAVITGTFSIEITVPNEDGMALIALEVPVCAYDNGSIAPSSNPVTWYIRGGLNNGMLDAGATPTAQTQGRVGGAIVVAFGTISSIPTITLIPAKPFN